MKNKMKKKPAFELTFKNGSKIIFGPEIEPVDSIEMTLYLSDEEVLEMIEKYNKNNNLEVRN